MLKQEISVIKDTLEDQLQVVEDFQPITSTHVVNHQRASSIKNRYYYGPRRHRPRPSRHLMHRTTQSPAAASGGLWPGAYEWPGADVYEQAPVERTPNDSSAVHEILFQDSLALIQKRIRDFQEMNDWASHLETWASSPTLHIPLCPGSFTDYIKTTEYPTHRLQQRPPRNRHLRLHHRDHHLPPTQRHRQHPRHEHAGHPEHGIQAVDLLGNCDSSDHNHHLAGPRLGGRVAALLEWGSQAVPGRTGSLYELPANTADFSCVIQCLYVTTTTRGAGDT